MGTQNQQGQDLEITVVEGTVLALNGELRFGICQHFIMERAICLSILHPEASPFISSLFVPDTFQAAALVPKLRARE